MPRKYSSQTWRNTNPVVSTLSCPSSFSTRCNFTVIFKHGNKIWDLHYVLNVPQTWYTWVHMKMEEGTRKCRAVFIFKRLLKHQAFLFENFFWNLLSFKQDTCTYRASQRSKSRLPNKWTTARPSQRLAVVRSTDQSLSHEAKDILRTAQLKLVLCCIRIHQAEDVEELQPVNRSWPSWTCMGTRSERLVCNQVAICQGFCFWSTQRDKMQLLSWDISPLMCYKHCLHFGSTFHTFRRMFQLQIFR